MDTQPHVQTASTKTLSRRGKLMWGKDHAEPVDGLQGACLHGVLEHRLECGLRMAAPYCAHRLPHLWWGAVRDGTKQGLWGKRPRLAPSCLGIRHVISAQGFAVCRQPVRVRRRTLAVWLVFVTVNWMSLQVSPCRSLTRILESLLASLPLSGNLENLMLKLMFSRLSTSVIKEKVLE